MNEDTSKRLDSIEKAILSMQAGIVSMEKSIVSMEKALIETHTRLDTVLPHLATKAELAPVVAASARFATKDELQAIRSDLIAWIIGTALTSVAVLAGLMTLASRLSWQ